MDHTKKFPYEDLKTIVGMRLAWYPNPNVMEDTIARSRVQERACAQAGLLDLLHPSGTLRFIYHREQGRLRFEIEGSDLGGESDTLAASLQIALDTLRSEGMVFDTGSCDEGSTDGQGRWIAISPHCKICSPFPSRHLGFQIGTPETESPEVAAIVPDFPRISQRRWLDFIAAPLLKDSSILRMEVEFQARELTKSEVVTIRSLFEERLTEHETLFGKGVSIGVIERFLGMWLRSGRGWIVRCRVRVATGADVPEAIVKMLANEIFGTPPGKDFAGVEDLLDIGSSYPEGWDFASLLPAPEYFDELTAQRILNAHVPCLPETGILLGHVENLALRIPHEMRDRHIYVAGATGTGKSTMLLNLIRQDMESGEGDLVFEPHGDLIEQVLEAVPANRRGDVTVIDPLSDEPPPGINILDVKGSPRPEWRIRFMIGELLRFFGEVWDMRSAGGPMFEMYLRNAILLLTDEGVREKSQHTLLDFSSILADRDFRNEQLEVCRNEDVKLFWNNIATKAGGESALANIVPYIVSKMDLLTQSSFIKTMIGQPNETLRIGEKMDRKHIVLCNLSKGVLGTTESRLLGTMLLAQIFAAGLERGMQPKATRVPVNIYVDEFQNFVSDNMASMLSEARKFGLRLILANQTLGQLNAGHGREDMTNTILGNAGHLVFFRLGVPDAEKLRGFTKPFTPEDMQTLPNYHAFVRLLTSEGPLKPLVMRT